MRAAARLLIAPAISLLLGSSALAQQPAARGIGVVTALQGQATVARTALPEPTPLRFKEDVFFRDVITTKERSTVRLLLGGKGVLTIREQSQVTLAEEASGGGRQSVLNLLSGKVGAAIAKSLMAPGESVEIRTPNAVAAVRGTVLIAEYIPAKTTASSRPFLLASATPGPLLAQAGAGGGQSTFYVLSGAVMVTVQGQPPVSLGAMQAVSITATPGGTQVGPVQNVTPAQATQAAQGLQLARPTTGEGEGGRLAQIQAQIAATLAAALLQAGTGQAVTNPAGTTSGITTQNTTQQTTSAPIVPTVPPSATTQNDLPSGSVVTIDGAQVLFSETPLAKIANGSPNTVSPITITGQGQSLSTSSLVADTATSPLGGGLAVWTAPLLNATGASVTHSGDLVTIQNSGYAWVDSADASVPMIGIEGTTFTNTNGYLVSLTGNSVAGSAGSLVSVLGGTLSSSGGGLLKAVNSQVYLGGSLLSLNNAAALTGSGIALDASNSYIGIAGPVFALQNGSRVNWSSAAGEPIIRLSNSTLYATGGYGQDDGTAGTGATIVGPLLEADNSQVSFAKLVRLSDSGGNGNFSIDAPAGTFQVRLTNGSSYTDTGDDQLLRFSDGTSTYHGLLLYSADSSVDVATQLLSIADSAKRVTTTATDPLIQTSNSSISTTDNAIRVWYGALGLAGPLVSASGTTFLTGDPGNNNASFISVRDGGILTGSGTGALVSLTNGSSISTQGDFLTVRASLPGSPSTVDLAGPLAVLDGSDFTSSATLGAPCCNFLTVSESGQVIGRGTAPFIQVSNGTVATDAHFAVVENGGSLSLAGPLASFTQNSLVTTGDRTANTKSFLSVFDGTQLTSTGTAPLITFDGSELDTAGNVVVIRRSSSASAPSTVTINGPLFSAINGSTINTTSLGYPTSSSGYDSPGYYSSCCSGFFVGQGGVLNSRGTAPLIQVDNSTFNAGPDNYSGGSFFSVSYSGSYPGETNTLVAPSRVSLAGGLLSATNGASITSLYSLLEVSGSTLTSTGTDPLIQLSGSARSPVSLNAGGTWSESSPPGYGSILDVSPGYDSSSNMIPASVSLQGPLLNATNADLTTNNGLVNIYGGGQLTSQTTSPLISLTGGTLTTSSNGAGLLRLSGTNVDPVTGLGTDQLLVTGGTILQANGTTINVNGPGNGIMVDTALLAASAPIVDLINATLNHNSTLPFMNLMSANVSFSNGATYQDRGMLNVYQSSVASLGPGIGLNNSLLTVTNGPLLNVTGGGNVYFNNADFLTLTNNAKVNVIGGPLISVSGPGSTVTIDKSLVNFLSTGNSVIINNGITPNQLLPIYVGGIPSNFQVQNNGGTVNLNTATPINNANGNTYSVAGSVLKVSNGGTITIGRPN